MILETEKLKLRPIMATDAEDIFEYAKDEETGPRAGWPPHKTIEDTKQIIDMWLNPNNAEKNFAIIYNSNKKVIGTIGITKMNNETIINLNKKLEKENINYINAILNEEKSIYEIGITLSRVYWNKGLATEALYDIIEYLFSQLKADIVLTLHYEANIGSKRIQEKNNMKVLGAFTKDVPWFNTDCSTMVVRYKTNEQWQNEKINC